ncbi:MAG: sugar phosphate isomerase/epimerase [Opitutaceae bacterium]|nr:sugar phosphate isomerase/epimerase [Opitutaceae bacterium]
MNLGVRAHDFGKLPTAELARLIADHGLNCIQLAPIKALAGCDSDLTGFTPAFATGVRDTFRHHGIHISVLGCYINLGDRDEASRRPQLERFKAHLRAARDFGCTIVGTETGSLNSDYSRHPDNSGEEAFAIVLASVRELVREAERYGVDVCIEAVERYVISSPQRLRRLVDEVNSPHLRVIYDPVNLLWSTNCARESEILEEAQTLLGEYTRILHAKDYTITDGAFRELSAGQGRLNYRKILHWAKHQHPEIDILLENTHPASIARTVDFLQQAYREA